MSTVKPRSTQSDKIVRLYSQAERARKLASRCGSQLVAEILEEHARLCERNAQVRAVKRRRHPNELLELSSD